MTTLDLNLDIPELLALFERDTPVERLQNALALVWTSTQQPTVALPQEQWLAMFRRCGYFSYGGPGFATDRRTRPTGPIRLYRGATDGFERGMAWSPSPAAARTYAFPLWTCEAPPSAVAAVLLNWMSDPSDPFYEEYILDLPADLIVEETSAPGHDGVVLHFRGKSIERVEDNVRQFLADSALDDLRPSALGWTVLHPRQGKKLASVKFTGYPAPLSEVARRHARWHY